jgi:hypothetical protein
MHKIILYADNERLFVAKVKLGYLLTSSVYDAMKFNTLEKAEWYANKYFPTHTFTFLEILA